MEEKIQKLIKKYGADIEKREDHIKWINGYLIQLRSDIRDGRPSHDNEITECVIDKWKVARANKRQTINVIKKLRFDLQKLIGPLR